MPYESLRRVDKILGGKNGHENICSTVAWKPGGPPQNFLAAVVLL